MVAYNFGAPAIDFAPLGQLGDRYARGIKQRHESEIAARREQALAGFGQNSDLAELGKTLLQAGDLEGGMSALRLAQAGQGTPWQREQAAKEQERYEAGRSDTAAERAKAEERYREGIARQDRPKYEPNLKEDGRGLGGMMGGRVFPDGRIIYDDGTTNTPGPQSGGAGDPNLPDPTSQTAGGQLAAEPNPNDYGVPTPNPMRERGYVIPGSLEGFPHGTVRMPGGAVGGPVVAPPAGRAAIAAPPIPPVTRGADLPAPGAQPQQAQLAPPGVTGGAAVAAPPTPAPAAPVAPGAGAVPRRANRADPLEPETVPYVRAAPPYVNVKEWVTAETKRIQNLAGGEGQTTGMKDKLAQARKTAPLIMEGLDTLNKEVKAVGNEWWPTAEKARMQTVYMNLVMQLKTMYELGALQKGDMDAVESILSNPALPWWNPIGNPNQAETTAEQVKIIKQIVAKGLNAAEATYGGDVNRDPGHPDLRRHAEPLVAGKVERYDENAKPIK